MEIRKTIPLQRPRSKDSEKKNVAKLPVLLIDDQLMFLTKAYNGITKTEIFIQGIKQILYFYGYPMGTKNIPGVTHGHEVCLIIMDPTKALPGIFVFDHNINGPIKGLKLAYIINLPITTLQQLITTEVEEGKDLVDSENRTILTAGELSYLSENKVNFRDFLKALKKKKELALHSSLSIIYTDEDEKNNYSAIPTFMTASLCKSSEVTKVFPKAGQNAYPKDFMNAINRREIYKATLKVKIDTNMKGTTSQINNQLRRLKSFTHEPLPESKSLPHLGESRLTTNGLGKSHTFSIERSDTSFGSMGSSFSSDSTGSILTPTLHSPTILSPITSMTPRTISDFGSFSLESPEIVPSESSSFRRQT